MYNYFLCALQNNELHTKNKKIYKILKQFESVS